MQKKESFFLQEKKLKSGELDLYQKTNQTEIIQKSNIVLFKKKDIDLINQYGIVFFIN